MNKNKKLFENKLVKFFAIPAAMLLLWIGLTSFFIYSFDTSFNVITYKHNNNNVVYNNHEKLIKGQKVSGEFQALEDNLGIVSLRFQTYLRPEYKNEDTLRFRIREKGSDEWLSESFVRNGLLYEIQPFPFGIPIISNSKDKIYYFEVESLNGNENNAVSISKKNQILFSKYQIAKSDLINDKKELLGFLIKKYINAFDVTQVRFYSLVFFLPFLFYIIWISPASRYIKKFIKREQQKKSREKEITQYVNDFLIFYPFHLLLLLIILIDILYVSGSNGMVYLTVLILWLFVVFIYKQSSIISFSLSIFLIILSAIFLQLENGSIAVKLAVWGYMFFIFGFIQIFYEFILDRK